MSVARPTNSGKAKLLCNRLWPAVAGTAAHGPLDRQAVHYWLSSGPRRLRAAHLGEPGRLVEEPHREPGLRIRLHQVAPRRATPNKARSMFYRIIALMNGRSAWNDCSSVLMPDDATSF